MSLREYHYIPQMTYCEEGRNKMVIPDDDPDIFRTRGPGRTAHLPAGVVQNVSSLPGVHCPGVSFNCPWAFPSSSEQSCSPPHIFSTSDRDCPAYLEHGKEGSLPTLWIFYRFVDSPAKTKYALAMSMPSLFCAPGGLFRLTAWCVFPVQFC